ncbi:MAG: phosphopantetheine-binding protein [Thermoleophilia bacterium]|nr:phosphopantetheine-binding protein [Thermoleophilia bacterium]MDH5281217.1 phosphopantetheine-binding protein [Thermoleophilia bacterium]
MTRDEITEAVLRALSDVAPEADPATLRPDVSLRDQLDIDSMDLLNFVIGIHEQVHVDIPEADYARLQTLDEVVDYLVGKTAS